LLPVPSWTLAPILIPQIQAVCFLPKFSAYAQFFVLLMKIIAIDLRHSLYTAKMTTTASP
jgi:hypothetical protein